MNISTKIIQKRTSFSRTKYCRQPILFIYRHRVRKTQHAWHNYFAFGNHYSFYEALHHTGLRDALAFELLKTSLGQKNFEELFPDLRAHALQHEIRVREIQKLHKAHQGLERVFRQQGFFTAPQKRRRKITEQSIRDRVMHPLYEQARQALPLCFKAFSSSLSVRTPVFIGPALINEILMMQPRVIYDYLFGKPHKMTEGICSYQHHIEVTLKGREAGSWCHLPTQTGGGPIQAIMLVRHLAFPEALKIARQMITTINLISDAIEPKFNVFATP